MKKLIEDVGESRGRCIQSAVIPRHQRDYAIFHLDDETALVLKAEKDGDGEPFLSVQGKYSIGDWEAEQLGLLTKAEIESKANKEREERRQKFLKLKAEFEPS